MSESNIIYLQNKKSGTIYAYEDKPYWDPEKKQSRSNRKLVGKVDPATGNIIPTRKRKSKETAMEEEKPMYSDTALPTISKVLVFLRLFVCETLAKRVVGMILIAVGVPEERVAELLDLSGKSVSAIKKGLEDGDTDAMFHIAAGGGRKRKLNDVEGSIIEEISNNNYHSHQQIADMVQEKYGIKVSLPVISRLLKKTESRD